MYCELDMRKTKTFKLDERLIAALESLAQQSGTTASNYLETLLFRHCQSQGLVPLNEHPPATKWGGKRSNAGRKKDKPSTNQADEE
jgi:hypothetical protein